MRILLPGAWCLPDDVTGELPKVLVDATEDTWLDLMNFWCNLGYQATSVTGQELVLEWSQNPHFKEKNAFMRSAWWKSLCNTQESPAGEVEGWAAVWMINPTIYGTGGVPIPIPNSWYVDPNDENVQVQRRWDQWGTQRHTHYYVENWSYENNTIVDKFLIPTWSWGENILGTEMDYGQNEAGVNLFDKDIFNKCLNQGGAVQVPIQPSDGTGARSRTI